MPRKKLVIDEEHVMSLKVVGLKKLCTKYKLAKRGRKAVLQDLILKHLQLGKYAVTVEADRKEETELDNSHSTVQSEPKEQTVQDKAQHEPKVNLSDGSVHQIQLKSVPELDDQPKSEEKLSSGETIVTTSESEKRNIISGDVEIAASKVETKVETLGELDVVTEETVENNENKIAGIKRTSSEATISDDDNTTEKKRKIAKNLANQKPEQAIAEVVSKEVLKTTGPEFEVELKPKDSVPKVSIKSRTSLEIEAIQTDSQVISDDEDALTKKPENDIVDQDTNLETKLDNAFSKADIPEKKPEEVVSKALVTKHDKAVSKGTQNASGSDMKIDVNVSKALQSQKDDEVPSKTVESEKKASSVTETKENLTTKKGISSTQKKKKESKTNSDGDTDRLSNQEKKPEKKKEIRPRNSQQNRRQERKGQNRNWNRNEGNKRNRNRNRGYQQSYPQPRSWLFSQGNWNSWMDPRMANSMPISQQRGSWISQNVWQQPNSYGGYGNDRRRSGGGSDWSRQGRGGRQNRRDGWRDNRRGRRDRR